VQLAEATAAAKREIDTVGIEIWLTLMVAIAKSYSCVC